MKPDSFFSTRRNLWPDSAASQDRILDSIQHCRRLWARRGCRVSTLLSDRPRLGERTAIPDPLGSRPEADPIRNEELSQEITEIKRMKDKRNKRHVGSIRPAFDRFPGRITASYNAFYVDLGRELPWSAAAFSEA